MAEGRGFCRPPTGRVQGCCQTSCSAPDGPTARAGLVQTPTALRPRKHALEQIKTHAAKTTKIFTTWLPACQFPGKQKLVLLKNVKNDNAFVSGEGQGCFRGLTSASPCNLTATPAASKSAENGDQACTVFLPHSPPASQTRRGCRGSRDKTADAELKPSTAEPCPRLRGSWVSLRGVPTCRWSFLEGGLWMAMIFLFLTTALPKLPATSGLLQEKGEELLRRTQPVAVSGRLEKRRRAMKRSPGLQTRGIASFSQATD